MRNQRTADRRRGTATLELALVLPVLMLLVLGAVEACNMIFVRNAVTAASYEAARIAIRQDANSADAQARAQEVLEQFGINGAQVWTNPGEVESLPRGSQVRVIVRADASSHSLLPESPYHGQWLRSRVYMVKE